MKAEPTKILDFMGKSANSQFIVPVYQRMYSWEEKHCKTLWNDILKAGENEKIHTHFLGSIMYIADSHSQTSINELRVIDGQQRLTTLTLLLIALSEALDGQKISDDKFTSVKIKNRYLINPDEEADKKFKLILSQADKETLLSLIDKDRTPLQEKSHKIEKNFKFFKDKLEEQKNKLEIICKGIDKLSIIDISLKRGEDDAQCIFESMNSTGKDLSQADLIRNYILMDLSPEKQDIFYKKYWRAMELEFGQDFYEEKFDFFVRHYLTIKQGEIPNINKIYEKFKDHHQNVIFDKEDLLKDLKKYCEFYCNMAFEKEQDSELKKSFKELLSLEAEVVFPFLLRLYDDYKKGMLIKNDSIKIVELIRNYIFRRSVCELSTASLNKTFATFFKAIKEDDYLESISANFCLLKYQARFPSDEEFKQKLLERNLYDGFKRKNYLLENLENFNKKESISINNYTIEHIMPQNIEKNEKWQRELGEDWKEIHKKYLHTLGNLTLTGYNSEYSNNSFKQKRDRKGGFKESPVNLNSMLKNLENFGEKEIKQRGEKLAEIALNIWSYPKISKEILEQYKPKNDHKHLREGEQRLYLIC